MTPFMTPKQSIALLSLLVAGCYDSTTLAIEDEFTVEEVDMIEWSINHWMQVTDTDDAAIFLRYDLHDDGGLTQHEFETLRDFGTIYRVTSDEPAVQNITAESGSSVNGSCRGNSILLIIDRITSERVFRHVMLHELGHFYGIHHQPDGLMASSVNSLYDCVDQRTLDEFCDMYDCGPAAAPSCE